MAKQLGGIVGGVALVISDQSSVISGDAMSFFDTFWHLLALFVTMFWRAPGSNREKQKGESRNLEKFTICLPNFTVFRKWDGKVLERPTVSVMDLSADQLSVGRIPLVIAVRVLPPMGPTPQKTGTKLNKTEHRSVLDGDCKF